MCQSTSCRTCQGTTWYGCGSHILSVLESVPKSERCHCEPQVDINGEKYPPGGTFGGMIMNMLWFGGKKGRNDGDGEKEESEL